MSFNNILVSRPDRIGDVILSTPALSLLKRKIPEARVTVLVQSNVVPLLEGLDFIDDIIEFKPKLHDGFLGVRDLAKIFREKRFDAFVALQHQSSVAMAAFTSGIPFRVGPRSQLMSLLYNHGVRQARSRVEKHEAAYNCDLIKPLLDKKGVGFGSLPNPAVSISDKCRAEAKKWLEKNGLLDNPIAIHPGMGGSALNWPQHFYQELIQKLVDAGRQVVVTLGPADLELEQCFAETGAIIWKATPNQSIETLGGLFSHCGLVVAPSTGPLHLASALSVPTISFYPKITVQGAKRWGPFQARDSISTVFEPDPACPEHYKCMGSACSVYPCMENIEVSKVFIRILQVEKSG